MTPSYAKTQPPLVRGEVGRERSTERIHADWNDFILTLLLNHWLILECRKLFDSANLLQTHVQKNRKVRLKMVTQQQKITTHFATFLHHRF